MEIEFDFTPLLHLLNGMSGQKPKVELADTCPDIRKARHQCERVMVILGREIAECLNDDCTATLPNGKKIPLKDMFSIYRNYVKVSGSLAKLLVGGKEFPIPNTFTLEEEAKIQKVVEEGSPIIRLALLEVKDLPAKYYKAALSGSNSIKSFSSYLPYKVLREIKVTYEDIKNLSPIAQLRVLYEFEHVEIAKASLEKLLLSGLFHNKDLVENVREKYRYLLKGVK